MQLARLVAFIALFSGIQIVPTYAQQVVATWTTGSGDLSNAADWSTFTVPNNPGIPPSCSASCYSVIINKPNSAVSLDLGVAIDNLTLGATNSLNINIGGGVDLVSVGSLTTAQSLVMAGSE